MLILLKEISKKNIELLLTNKTKNRLYCNFKYLFNMYMNCYSKILLGFTVIIMNFKRIIFHSNYFIF